MAEFPGSRTTTRRGRRTSPGAAPVRLPALVTTALATTAALALCAVPAHAATPPGTAGSDDARGSGRPVIVRLGPGADPDAAARQAAARGARVTQVYHDVFPGYAAVLPAGNPGGGSEGGIEGGIEGGPDVVAVDPDTPVGLSVTERTTAAPGAARPGGGLSWGLDRIDQRGLPLSSTYAPPRADAGGRGVTAYVIDSGVDAAHRDLAGRVRRGFTTIDDGRGTGDCAGHGTHVAGTIGGAARGVASAVTLVAVRTLDCEGSGETSGVVAGIDWVARDHRAGTPAVANLSLAGEANDSVDAAIRGLVADGVTVAVAAGNENADACRSSPAREPSALTVGASARDDSRASFSNRGSCVDLFAPGVDIVSDWNTSPTATDELSGTSMASPHVAGAAALLLGASPALTPAQVAARLLAAATHGAVRGTRRGDPDRLLYVGSAVPAGTAPGSPAPPVPARPAVPGRPASPARG